MRARSIRFASAEVVVAVMLSQCMSVMPEPTPEPLAWAPGTSVHTIQSGGDSRSYRLHVPPHQSRNIFGFQLAYPVVVVLHGSGADGADVERQSGMDSVADANGWLAVYPDAVGGALGFGSDWNAGTCCGAAAHDSVNDVAFVLAAIDAITSRLPVNAHRIYVAGFSAGARMAHHLACQAAGRVAAVAVVAGSVLDARCRPAVPVPILIFHGTGDDEVPYAEESATPVLDPVPGTSGLPPAVQLWASIDRCRGPRATRVAPHATQVDFRRCRADVLLYSITDG
ncbi:MAG TPA: PHB depolymerase family esterase, partial [Gemmatimonadaceae bacterium]|nr:PHB depolymerase family esterase [Gemmatimonadaceae bacterium]